MVKRTSLATALTGMQRSLPFSGHSLGSSTEEVLQISGTIRVCNYNIAVNCERTTQFSAKAW